MSIFDKFAKNYDEGHAKAVKLSGLSTSYFHEYKVREVFNYLCMLGLEKDNLNILNYGCGTGNSERYLREYFPNASVYSIDVSAKSIETAIEDNKDIDDLHFSVFDGQNIPFDKSFDVIFVANVFHHIPHKEHENILKNIHEKLKINGLLFLFELNPLNPLTLWVAFNNDYKFDKNAKLLNPLYANRALSKSGFVDKKIRYTVFFPGFLSSLIHYEKYLHKLPIGAHYYYIARKTVV